MYDAMLDGWLEEYLENSFISPHGDIDGRDENYEAYFTIDWNDGPIKVKRSDGYLIQIVDISVMDRPLVVCREPSGDVVGWYTQMMAWVDPDHRSKGLGVDMILQYADFFKEHAWDRDDIGILFSDAGFAIHQSALARAKEIAELDISECQGPAPFG